MRTFKIVRDAFGGLVPAKSVAGSRGFSTMEAGDLVWQSSSTMHGWVNRGDVPLRFIELQAPRPPSSNAVVFENSWTEVAERSLPRQADVNASGG